MTAQATATAKLGTFSDGDVAGPRSEASQREITHRRSDQCFIEEHEKPWHLRASTATKMVALPYVQVWGGSSSAHMPWELWGVAGSAHADARMTSGHSSSHKPYGASIVSDTKCEGHEMSYRNVGHDQG